MIPAESTSSSDWVLLRDAPTLLDRPKPTIYKWVERGEVRTFQPLHETWLFLPDLRNIDARTPRRRHTKAQS